MNLKKILFLMVLAVGSMSAVVLGSSFQSPNSTGTSKVSGKPKKAGKKLPVLIDNSVYDVVKVQFTDTATVLTMRLKGDDETDALIGSPFLKINGVKKGFQFRHGHIKDAKKTPISTTQKVKPGEEVMMYFDPLPKNTKEFIYSEFTGSSNKRNQIGIRVDGKKYHSSNFSKPVYPRRDHLPAYEAKVDTTVLVADMNMPKFGFSWLSSNSPWSDAELGYNIDVDSLSKISASRIDMLPTSIRMRVNDINLAWLAIPGNTTRIIFDAPAYAEMIANGADQTDALYDAFLVYDAHLPEYYTTKRYVKPEWHGAKFDWLALPYETYIDSISHKMDQASLEIESIENLSGAEKELLHIINEKCYVDNRNLYYLYNGGKLTDEEKKFLNSDQAQIDPKAASFYSATSPGAIYVFGAGDAEMANYLKANGLSDAPLCKTLDYYNGVLDSMTAARANMNEDESLGIRTLPECPPTEILDSIVARHRGKTVLVDFWNTWCGPCLMGMEGMEKYKDDLIKKGVEFVYIANESSPEKVWRKMVKEHKGNHYFILSKMMGEMKVPEFKGSIPFYLIYRPDGTLHYTQSGWGGPEALLEKIEEASSVQ